MNEHLLYKTILLETIVAALRQENIEVNVRTAVDIGTILSATDLSAFSTFSSLKYRLAPVISRNKEEQEIIHKIFDNLDAKIKSEQLVAPTRRPDSSIKPQVPRKRSIKELISGLPLWKKVVLILVSTGLTVLIALLIFYKPVRPEFRLDISSQRIVYEPVTFFVKTDSVLMSHIGADWHFEDTVIKNKLRVERTFADQGQKKLTVYIKNNKGELIDSITQLFNVLCEPVPQVNIQSNRDSSRASRSNARRIKYRAIFTNPKKTG